MGADACPQAEAGMPPGPGARRRPKVRIRSASCAVVGRATSLRFRGRQLRMWRLRHRSRVSRAGHTACAGRSQHALHLTTPPPAGAPNIGVALSWRISTCVGEWWPLLTRLTASARPGEFPSTWLWCSSVSALFSSRRGEGRIGPTSRAPHNLPTAPVLRTLPSQFSFTFPSSVSVLTLKRILNWRYLFHLFFGIVLSVLRVFRRKYTIFEIICCMMIVTK